MKVSTLGVFCFIAFNAMAVPWPLNIQPACGTMEAVIFAGKPSKSAGIWNCSICSMHSVLESG